jgi:hypothetical protein
MSGPPGKPKCYPPAIHEISRPVFCPESRMYYFISSDRLVSCCRCKYESRNPNAGTITNNQTANDRNSLSCFPIALKVCATVYSAHWSIRALDLFRLSSSTSGGFPYSDFGFITVLLPGALGNYATYIREHHTGTKGFLNISKEGSIQEIPQGGQFLSDLLKIFKGGGRYGLSLASGVEFSPSAGNRILFLVQQGLDLEELLDVTAAVHSLFRRCAKRPDHGEFAFPVAQYMGRHSQDPAYLTYPEESLIRDAVRGHSNRPPILYRSSDKDGKGQDSSLS